MNQHLTREDLLVQADSAFHVLAQQVSYLLDAAQVFADQHPVVSVSDRIKSRELNAAIRDLGMLPRAIGAEVERWKQEGERVLSVLGVEVQLLNELYATMDASLLFFVRENVPLVGYSMSTVRQAHNDLLRCNRLL